MFKLRTMVNGAHAHAPERHASQRSRPTGFKIRNDPRLHPLGRFLRRTSIDELPNFINVIFGHMALVGPRPALPSEIDHYDAFARRRLEVPQGVNVPLADQRPQRGFVRTLDGARQSLR